MQLQVILKNQITTPDSAELWMKSCAFIYFRPETKIQPPFNQLLSNLNEKILK